MQNKSMIMKSKWIKDGLYSCFSQTLSITKEANLISSLLMNQTMQALQINSMIKIKDF